MKDTIDLTASAPAPVCALCNGDKRKKRCPCRQRPDNVGQTKEELIAELNAMIGLDRVKEQVAKLASTIEHNKARTAAGMPVPTIGYHMLFRGAPGTGKTTVARLLAKIFRSMGVLSKGHLVEKDRAGLVGQHVGETAPKVAAVVKQALGGILFIDEAYSLNSKDDYGSEAINTLLTRMEEHRSDLIVIAAGYDKEMDKFLASNSGLASRFTHNIQFDDYTPQQLLKIFIGIVDKHKIELTTAARDKLKAVLHQMYNQRGPAFGNGRAVRNLFERAYQNMGVRRALNVMDADDISL